MNKYLTALVGILLGIIGVLAGMFTSTNSKRKIAEKKAEDSISSQKATEEITNIVTRPSPAKKPVEKKNGIIGKMIIIFALAGTLSACAYYEPVCPALFVITKPDDFQDIEYKYDSVAHVFTFSQENMDELKYQMTWAKDTIKKYEAQITKYNKFRKGETK